MDDTELRTLATRLRADLENVVADPIERDRIDAELDTALHADPIDRDALQDVINAHEPARAWFARNAPVTEDVDRNFELLAGDADAGIYYYVCPQGDADVVFDVRPRRPPRCPKHDIEMITED